MAETVDRSNMIARMNEALVVDPASSVVVTIDCQRGNLDPEIASLPVPVEDCSRVIDGTNRMLAMARCASIPVIHMTTVFEAPLLASHPFEKAMLALGQSFAPHTQSDFKRHKSPGSIEAQFMPALDVQPSDLIVDGKRTFDSFEGTPLALLLHAMKKDTLLIAGCNTNTCVLSTAFGAYNRRLRVIVVSDCVASAYGDDMHDFALANIQRRLGWVLTLDELDAKLMRQPEAAASLVL